MQVRFLADPIEANDQLRVWGLDRETLKEAVFFAQSFYNECTDNDPLGFDKSIAYARAARRLRDLYGPDGWLRDNSNNQAAIRNESRRLRLYPCNFCSYTAHPFHQPVNLTDKGSAARGDTYVNAQLPLPLFHLPHVLPGAEVAPKNKYTTLLLGMNFEEEAAKAEVSVPVNFYKGKFKSLVVRVPLLDGTEPSPRPAAKPDQDDFFGVVDIPVARKL